MLKKMAGWTVLVLVVAYVGRDGIGREATAAQATSELTVATVNIAKLFTSLDEMKQLESRLTALNRRLVDDRSVREAAAVELEEVLAALDPGSSKYIETAQDLLLAQNDLRGYEDYRLQTLDLNRALLIESLYWKVTEAAAEIANNGYDLVMIDDAHESFGYSDGSNVPRSLQVERQIGSRVLLHARPALDVTQELAVFLNNAYRASLDE